MQATKTGLRARLVQAVLRASDIAGTLRPSRGRGRHRFLMRIGLESGRGQRGAGCVPGSASNGTGPIAWCVIDRPAARNAFTPAMYFGIKQAVRLVNTDPDLAALGHHRAPATSFAPGRRPRAAVPNPVDRCPEGPSGVDILPFLTVRDSPAPVIAAVNGICQAGGLLIAMMADIAVASDRATFRVPELLRGIPRRHVRRRASRPMLGVAGRSRPPALSPDSSMFGGGAPPRADLARPCPTTQLRAAALEAARQILRTAPEARAQVEAACSTSASGIDRLPDDVRCPGALTREPREGMAAFMEKRRRRIGCHPTLSRPERIPGFSCG